MTDDEPPAKKGEALYTRLANLLQDATKKRGGQAALARELGLSTSEISDLIHNKRFVTLRQALAIEGVLGAPARELLIDAAIAKIDEDLTRARGIARLLKHR
jgi:plasmid maintenance system antidote protein VapI